MVDADRDINAVENRRRTSAAASMVQAGPGEARRDADIILDLAHGRWSGWADRLVAAVICAPTRFVTEPTRGMKYYISTRRNDIMEKVKDAPLTLDVFDKYVVRLEQNMATKADVASVKEDVASVKEDVASVNARIDRMEQNMATKADVASVNARIDKTESGTWTRLDRMEQNMATKADVASVKEDTVRIRRAMAEDDADIAKVKKRLDEMERPR